MKYIADVVIFLILLIFVLRGYKKGLVKTLFGLFTVFLSLAIAASFAKSAGGLIRQTTFYENMYENVEQYIEEYEHKNEDSFLLAGFDKNTEKSAIPDALSKYGVSVADLLGKHQAKNQEDLRDDENIQNNRSKSLAQKAADSVMTAFSNAVGFVCVFVLSLVALKLVRFLLDALMHLPLLNWVNKLGGLVTGLAIGVSFVFVLTAICEFLLPYIPQNPVLYSGMHNDTLLYSFFVSINPVFLILFG